MCEYWIGKHRSGAVKIHLLDGSDVGLVAAAVISEPEQNLGRIIELLLPPHRIQDVADAIADIEGLPLEVTHVAMFL